MRRENMMTVGVAVISSHSEVLELERHNSVTTYTSPERFSLV